jgi:hypothetical protein
MDKMVQDFTGGLRDFFGGVRSPNGSRGPKSARAEGSVKKFNKEDAVNHGFLEEALTAGLTGVAQVTARHVEQLEKRTTKTEQQVGELNKRVTELNGVEDKVGALNARVDKLMAENASLKDEVAATQRVGESVADNAGIEALRKEMNELSRKRNVDDENASYLERWAIVGNVGFDTPANILCDRVKKALEDAGAKCKYDMLCAVRDPGSMVTLRFESAADLKFCNAAIRCLKRKHPECNAAMWLDRQKTDEERLPARHTHKAFDVLKMLAQDKDLGEELTKDIKSKRILLGTDKCLAYMLDGDIKFTLKAKGLFSEQEIEQARAFALS